MLSFVMLKDDANLIQLVTSTIFLLCSILYAIFPLVFAITRRSPIKKSQYLWSCFLINLIITLAVQGLPIISYVLSSFFSYIVSTLIFSFCGIAILKLKKCLINDSASQRAKFKLMQARVSSVMVKKTLWDTKADYRKAKADEREKRKAYESLEDSMAKEAARIEWLEAKEARVAIAALAAQKEKELQKAAKDAKQDIKQAKAQAKKTEQSLRKETRELRDLAEERQRKERKEAKERKRKERQKSAKKDRIEEKKEAAKKAKLEEKKEAAKKAKLEEKKEAAKKAKLEEKKKAAKKAELEKKKAKVLAKVYFCKKCGTELHKNGRYCQKCGERVFKQ